MRQAVGLLIISIGFLFSPSFTFAQPVDLVVQTGHNGDVKSVAFSPDGRYIASACVDGAIKLIDARLGFEIFTFYEFSESAFHVCFSADSKYLLGTGTNVHVLWDLSTGKKLAVVVTGEAEDDQEKMEESVSLFSNDGRYCFTAAGTIQRWELDEIFHPEKYSYENGSEPVMEDSVLRLTEPSSALFFSGHTGEVTGMCISKDDKFLVSVSTDSTIRVWDVMTGKQIRMIKCKYELSAVAISNDGKKIITTEKDLSATAGMRCWDLETGRQLLFIPNRNGYINTLSLSADGSQLIAGTLMGKIEVYNFPSLKFKTDYKAHESWINSIDFSGDGKFFVSGGEDDAIKIWENPSLRLARDLRKTIASIDNLAYENNHRLITTTASEKNKQQTIGWEIEHGIGFKNIYTTKSNVFNDELLSIDTAGHTLMLSEDSSIVLYDPGNGKLLKKVIIPLIGSAMLSPAGDYVLYQDRVTDNLFRLNVKENKPVFFAEYPDKDSTRFFKKIDEMDFSPDGKYVAGGGIGPDVFIWTTTGKYIRNLNYLDADSTERKNGEYAENESIALPNAMINDLKFSPDGKLIAAACRMPDPVVTGGLIIVWEVETGKLLHWKAAHNYIIQSIDWSPDGKFLVTGSNDKWLKVWNYADFAEDYPEPVFSYRNDFTPVHTSFTRDNKWLLSAGIDGKIIIRKADDYKTIATLIGLNNSDFVAVTGDQYYAASKMGTKLIAFRQGVKIYPATQFDIRFNRPDKVLEALGSSDTNLVRSYRNAYYKRIKKLGIDTSLFNNGFSAPQFDIERRDTIEYTRKNRDLLLHVKGEDSIYKLERFNVWINEVPLYGQNGIIYKSQKLFLDTVISIKLSEGENRIETSVINTNGTESFRQPLLVNYTPVQKQMSKTYFIGIGIDRFADSTYNLSYSTKDIHDLAKNLQAKYGKNLVIDTLFNSEVNVDNIRRLRQKLIATGEDDKVIVSYSGHGMLSSDFDYYLSTYNVNFNKPEENGLPYDALQDLMDSIPARKKLLLIDACHSGEVDKEDLVVLDSVTSSLKLIKGLKPVGFKKDNKLGLHNSFELMQNLFINVGKSTGATVISAAAGTEFALERNDLRNGVFTYSILEAMKKNKTMTVSGLKKYVSERVFELTNGLQQPTARNENISVDWDIW